MSGVSGIEWCDRTWEVTAGCTHVSSGCANCYAETLVAGRFSGVARRRVEDGLANGSAIDVSLEVIDAQRKRWNGEVRLLDMNLAQPLSRRAPTVYFVNSRSDLFHERVPFSFIDRVFEVMTMCPQHRFLVLTKRPGRMREYLTSEGWSYDGPGSFVELEHEGKTYRAPWPLPNVWLGTSCEDQAAADARVPELLACPAAGRFVSAEPLLGPVDLDRIETRTVFPGGGAEQRWDSAISGKRFNEWAEGDVDASKIDWVIVGGESGQRARACHLDWIRSIVVDCQGSGTPVYVKQLGKVISGDHEFPGWKGVIDRWYMEDGTALRRPVLPMEYDPEPYHGRPEGSVAFGLAHPRGGVMSEWPEDLRVRELPVGIAEVMDPESVGGGSCS